MDDFRRKPVNRVEVPSRPLPPVVPAVEVTPALNESVPPQPIQEQPQSLFHQTPKKPWKKRLLWVLIGIIGATILTFGAILIWYFIQLSPVDSANTDKKVITIETGSTPNAIAEVLKDEGLIRSPTAFLWYARLQGVQNNLQAGTYRLSPSESTQAIIEHLTKGNVDTFSIRFLPGATLADNREVLIKQGYSAESVDTALAKDYDSPLFAGKPAPADLEGYIYGETYNFGTDTSVEAILEYVFAQFYSVIEENDLKAAYEAQGLSLYEGITLASIVQREASPGGDDMAQISQVFYSRLEIGMALGSDVTYQYIADKTGVARDTNIDSPYNTRRYTGLPPGPISAPGEKALVAVANPAEGDYLYFLSGDDDVTYFGRTLKEHESNIVTHCQVKCQIV